MIGEFGFFFLLVALMFALALMLIPTVGVFYNNKVLQNTATLYATGQFIALLLAYLALTYCFYSDDFSLTYVMANSSVSLPWFYKLCAVWGGHEGSMLLWVMILNIWLMAVCLSTRMLDDGFRVRVLALLGALCSGFLLFIIFTSNPFVRQFAWLDSSGRDLNPLLQDPGFLFHPPMLYMGYVGFSVAFAFALAALWSGQIESAWAKWVRPWTLAAWSCLTLGITLGSWWAYRELGWGGWWFWDPVENASFMPWLAGTALVHSLAVTEQRKQFFHWTLLLAITTFSLSLIGTFLVRSGVLTSVHAFAVDPQRGLFILAFLFIVIGGSLFLFALRGQQFGNSNKVNMISRESILLLNNIFLTAAMLSVLLGTLYPLLIDGLGLGKLSVGAPYFNKVFVPLMLPVLFLMGWGIQTKWQKDDIWFLARKSSVVLMLAVILPMVILIITGKGWHWNLFCGLAFAFWIILSTSNLVIERIRQHRQMPQTFWGMVLAHLGIAFTTLGIVISNAYGIQDDMRMAIGDTKTMGGYRLTFTKEIPLQGANYHGTRAEFLLEKNGTIFKIYPEKRIYDVAKMAMTESAIDANFFRDLYIALGESLGEGSWAVRFYYKPFIRWIWGGGFFILFGGLLAMSDPRYFLTRKKTALKNAEIMA